MTELYAWCRDRADRFQAWEHVEMAMFPAPADRDVALVEWVVRTLGNPSAEGAREVLDELRARHDDPSWPAVVSPLSRRSPGEALGQERECGWMPLEPIDVMGTLNEEESS